MVLKDSPDLSLIDDLVGGLTIMDIAKNIFFLIGSILGILAFAQSFFKPALDSNRKRWAEIQEYVNDTDFREVQSGTWNHRVDGRSLFRIDRLTHDIGEDAEYLRFGPVLRKQYEKVLSELVETRDSYRDLVQVPYWEPVVGGNAEAPANWRFNRSAFIGDKGYPDGYAPHLEEATARAEKMRTVYKKLALLSELHLWEVPFAHWIIAHRVKKTAEI